MVLGSSLKVGEEGMGSFGNGELWGTTGLGAPSHKLHEQPWPRTGKVPLVRLLPDPVLRSPVWL